MKMPKNFDCWNHTKKSIHAHDQNKLYHRRDIWWCSIGVNIGFEEDGKGDKAERPVLILHGFSRQLCWVVPLTSVEKINKYYIFAGNIGGKRAFAIISQLRLIDTKRLSDKLGYIEKEYFMKIKQAIKDIL